MGVVEDVRMLLQELVAPKLDAIIVRLDSLEKRMDALERRMDRFEDRFETRSNEIMGQFQNLLRFQSLEQQLAQVVEKQKLLDPKQ